MIHQDDDKNIILNQIYLDQSTGKYLFKELKPFFSNSLNSDKVLNIDNDGNIFWAPYIKEVKSVGSGENILESNKDGVISLRSLVPGNNVSFSIKKGNIIIDASFNPDISIIEDDKIKGTDIFYSDDRIGIGRLPLYSYKFDVAVPENTLMTAFHVGDGKFGFSMGNGTKYGFIPEIIGMGSDENDPGLYFLSKAGNDSSSNVPLIVLDARKNNNTPLENRPILGVKSGSLSKYELIVNNDGKVGIGKYPEIYKMEVEGTIKANDFVLDTSISFKELVDIIIDQKKQIDILKETITDIIKNL